MPLLRAHRIARLFGLLAMAAAVVLSFVVLGGRPSDAAALPPGGSFIDDDLNPHEGYIEAITEIGVTSGCEVDEYCPRRDVTREQMASFLARALGLPTSPTDHFTDDTGSVHEANINKLAEAGISLGCGGSNYCPNQPVSRAQMASFLARAFDLPATSVDFFPDDSNSGHEGNINRIAADGITLGCGSGLYCPYDDVPRDQMASFLGRGLDLTEIKPPFPVRTLVERFYEYDPTRDGVKRYDVDGVYRPRQFAAGFDIDPDHDDTYPITNAGQYNGWDVFIPDREWSDSSSNEYINISLTRPARVAVVWVARWDPRPGWLGAWALSGTVGIDNEVANVYEKTLGYGENWIPGPSADGDYSRNYILLFAETDSDPTVAPPVPAGEDTPQPNQLCPVWVHDNLYLVAGPDGEMYGSWHPQIDPTHWCHFGHEHGSNPALIPGKPKVAYQYVAAKVPQNEPDIGFKETIFQTPTGYWVRFIDHADTSGERRVCAQLHTVYAMVYTSSGEEVFRMGFKADFGASESTDDGFINSTDCGYDMAALAETTSSSKRIRTSADSNDYERWDAEPTVEAANLGMVFEHEFDVRDPFTFCPGLECNDMQFHNDGQTGTRRTADNEDFVFDWHLALGTGTYYTNPYGTAIVASGAADAVEQYIENGFYLNLGIMGDGHFVATEPWYMLNVCNDNLGVGSVNISNSLDPEAWVNQLGS